MTETAAARAVRATQNMQPKQIRGILDKAAKHLVADRQILAWLVKSCVPEAAEYSLQQLAEECIPGEIEIAETALHREDEEASGMSADPGRARLDNTEDSSTADGTVHFDILFTLTLPQETDPILMIINVEIQNRSDAGYPLKSRAVTYACRLVSRQGTDYGNFKKVYSIWIVSNPDAADENTIEQIGLFEKRGDGGMEPAPPEASLFEIRFLNPGGYQEARTREAAQILQLMDVLFSRDLDADQKIDIASRDFGIQATAAVSRNLQEVYTMELALETRARQEGERRGKRIGAAQAIISLLQDMGAEESTIIEKLMKKLDITEESALKYMAEYGAQDIDR